MSWLGDFDPSVPERRLMTRYQFREVIEQGIGQFVMPDICWCGGISEAKIATMAETHYLPIAPHNCGGPSSFASSIWPPT
jgi:L-alanine-DL-glutamate epimerase-like enolase superfamily enzyme